MTSQFPQFDSFETVSDMDGSRVPGGFVNPNFADQICAVASDTLLPTDQGEVAAQDLTPCHSLIDIRGRVIGISLLDRCVFERDDLIETPEWMPIRFDDDLNDGPAPSRALLVSGDMPVLADAETNHHCLAKNLADGAGIRRVLPEDGITYVRISTAKACVINVAGLALEFAPRAELACAICAELPPARPELDLRAFRPVR